MGAGMVIPPNGLNVMKTWCLCLARATNGVATNGNDAFVGGYRGERSAAPAHERLWWLII